MMNVLVTGGAGYIGSITVQQLRQHGYNVVVLDTLEKGFAEALNDTPLIVGNVADQVLLAQVFQEYAIDAVIHFAAYKAANESMANPRKYFENNTAGSLALLGAMHEAGVRTFVFSSTAAVYGTPDYTPVDEAHPTRPESPYGESKLLVERMLRWLDQSGALRFVSLRYYNAAGATLDGAFGEAAAKTENLIPAVMKAILGTGPQLKVFGTDYPTPDGTTIRDYVHVLDVAAAHIKSLEFLAAGTRSDTFNIGTGTGSSVLDVLRTAERISGRRVPVEYAPRRAGDPIGVWADTTKASEVLGWRAQYDLEAIIASSWAWHAAHPNGYGRDEELGPRD